MHAIGISLSSLDLTSSICHRGNRPFFTGNINWSLYILSLWLWFLPVSKTFWDVLMHCIYYSSNENSVSEAQGCLFLSSVTVPLSWCKTADSIWWERSKGLLLSIAQRVALLSQTVISLCCFCFLWCVSEWKPVAHFRCRMLEIFVYCRPSFESRHSGMKGSITLYQSLEPSRLLLYCFLLLLYFWAATCPAKGKILFTVQFLLSTISCLWVGFSPFCKFILQEHSKNFVCFVQFFPPLWKQELTEWEEILRCRTGITSLSFVV